MPFHFLNGVFLGRETLIPGLTRAVPTARVLRSSVTKINGWGYFHLSKLGPGAEWAESAKAKSERLMISQNKEVSLLKNPKYI